MHNPKISVYIPCHNHADYIIEAIESVLNQTFSDWELIIINDGSTDNSAELLKLYEGVPRISVYHTDTIGLPKVCNFAISKAKGQYIIRLDGDDIFDANILLVLSNYLDINTDAALVFPDYYLMDLQGNIYSHEQRGKLYQDDHLLDMPPNGACILARTDILKELGGYREDLGAQDGFDLWSKVTEKYKCGNINLPLFYYRRHNHNLTNNSPLIAYARRQIKKDIALKKTQKDQPILCIIPCRQHFDFTQDLWDLRINEESLLEKSIKVCLKLDSADHIIVTCDNPKAEETVKKFKDSRLKFVLRDHKSTLMSAPLTETLEKIIRLYDPEAKGITIVRYLHTPFFSKDSLEEALYTLQMTDAESAVAIEEVRDHDLYYRDKYGLRKLNVRNQQIGRAHV